MSLIRLQQVNMVFKVRKERHLKSLLIPGSRRFNDFTQDGSVHALRDMTFTLNDGDRLAVIGHNGAGKSTLLKAISGIYPVTSGELTVDGRISGMFELATGFEMEQNGWDNIYLRGLMLGETPKGIKAKMREIAEFTELGSFLDMPVKYYSSGMFIRLAFSVSTAIRPNILLLDEIVGAGDAAFMQKAKQRMRDMMQDAKILVLVTHNLQDALDLCNRCIWLERGTVMKEGSPKEVCDAYLLSMTGKAAST